MKIPQIVACVLALVCVGLPPLHSEAIAVDGYPLLSVVEIGSHAGNQQVDSLPQLHKSPAVSDGQTVPATPSIPHCDFEVSPIDHPPLCLLAPPGTVRIHGDQRESSPVSFTIDIVSPPPRQA